MPGAVDHQGDRRGERRVGGQLGERRPVRGRVRDQHVVGDAGADQPDRLGQGERHHAVPAGSAEHPAEQLAAADRLAGHPDRLAAGAGGQRGGVGVEGGEVDHRERRVEVGGRPVEALAQSVACRWPRVHANCPDGNAKHPHVVRAAVGGTGGLGSASRRMSPVRRPPTGSRVFHRGCPAMGRHVEVRPSKASRTASRPACRAGDQSGSRQPPTADPSGCAAIRSVLRIRPFRRLWIVLGAASFGDWLGLLATAALRRRAGHGSTAQGAAFGGVIADPAAAGAGARPGRRRLRRPVRPALDDGHLRPDAVRALRLDPARRAARRRGAAWWSPGRRSPPS